MRDWQAFDAALAPHVPRIARELLGEPRFRAGDEWRWGRKGSLSLVVAGTKAGMWFDHEAGTGGGLVDLVTRELGRSRRDALDWLADRIGMASYRGAIRPRRRPVAAPAAPSPAPKEPGHDTDTERTSRAEDAANRSARAWSAAVPAPADHPYLTAKQIAPHALRMDGRRHLVVPLQDPDGALHTLEFIAPDGGKRFLAGGAKRGHFAVLGAEPAPLETPAGPVLICEGWATGASLHLATGHVVIAAMDAGNLLPVAEALRAKFSEADLVLVADNDARPDRDTNPGVEAARKAARAVEARLAVPTEPGDANDLFLAAGKAAVAALVAGAAPIPPEPPTWPEPVLSVEDARASLDGAIGSFMEVVPEYWATVDAGMHAVTTTDPLDFNGTAGAAPPLLGLPVETGLGKSRAARSAIAALIANGGLGGRKVVLAVPRHDLGAEQVAALEELGLRAMLWKGRSAPDPAPEDPERLMCRDTEATFDALEIEHPVEQSCCKLRRKGQTYLCPHHGTCGYQRQKAEARAAQVIVCAHDSLFHAKAEAIVDVGLLVIDEGFWQAGLRGIDGKALLTLDGLEPVSAGLTCYTARGRIDHAATADLIAMRERLARALRALGTGPLPLALLRAVGLTARDCREAATLERARLRDAGLLPGMSASERRRCMEKVLPAPGTPWAPPGRCAVLWLILATALERGHDAAGAELVNAKTENGTVRALRLRWRAPLRTGWAAGVPVLHLDATLRGDLVAPYLPSMPVAAPVTARQPHVRVRQVTGSPTSARALTPAPDAPEREQKAAATHLRDIAAWIALRARQCRREAGACDLLVIGQKAAIDALRAAGLPRRVEAVHFNALSGLDRWGDVAGMVVLGRTLPAPATVEMLATALTGRRPVPNPEEAGWWYPTAERRLRLADGRSAPLAMEEHADPVAEAVRWSVCEGELIQAIGRGRGVNRTADTPLEIDLLTDVALPVALNALVPWSELRPTRRDLMALSGAVLENAANMAKCFPDLWPTRDAAKKDKQRKGTNRYYRDLYNSRMSPSSVEVTWRPVGAGQRPRTAPFDLTLIPDPETWLAERLGALALFAMTPGCAPTPPSIPHPTEETST